MSAQIEFPMAQLKGEKRQGFEKITIGNASLDRMIERVRVLCLVDRVKKLAHQNWFGGSDLDKASNTQQKTIQNNNDIQKKA